ncbi:MAG: DUF2752 domain-containing protein [Phycisphaerales bacterium]|nr:DUF2752 domain-containing protein [Phycisphaerales bacterium]
MSAPTTHPSERTTPLRSSTGERIAAGLVAIITLAVLTTAAWLTPNPDGHATHTQLGMNKCTWVVWFDKPCPTCGMTTSFSHAGEGSWTTATLTQPMGALLALLTTMIFWGATHQALTGSRIGSVAQTAMRPKLVITMLALAAAAWVYKINTWS